MGGEGAHHCFFQEVGSKLSPKETLSHLNVAKQSGLIKLYGELLGELQHDFGLLFNSVSHTRLRLVQLNVLNPDIYLAE